MCTVQGENLILCTTGKTAEHVHCTGRTADYMHCTMEQLNLCTVQGKQLIVCTVQGEQLITENRKRSNSWGESCDEINQLNKVKFYSFWSLDLN